jgi:hypothetical protein
MHGLLGFCSYIEIVFTSQVWVHDEMDPTRNSLQLIIFGMLKG